MAEDASWRQDAQPGTEGERAQLRFTLLKAELLAIFVERILWEDREVAKRWPKLRGILKSFRAELQPLRVAEERARHNRKHEAQQGTLDHWTAAVTWNEENLTHMGEV